MANLEKKWYVVYTLTRHEKSISRMLNHAKVEFFLPKHTVVRQWSDRKKKVTVPMFPNYLFVRITNQEFWKVMAVNGVVRFITLSQQPIPIADSIIDNIKKILGGNIEIGGPKMEKGELVRIAQGPFVGAQGHFIRLGKKNLLVVEVELIRRTVMLEIDPAHIERLSVGAR